MLDSVKLRGVNRVQETARMFWIQVWEEEDGRRLIEQSSVLPQLSAGAPVLRWSSTDTSSPAASYCLTVRGAWALPRRLVIDRHLFLCFAAAQHGPMEDYSSTLSARACYEFHIRRLKKTLKRLNTNSDHQINLAQSTHNSPGTLDFILCMHALFFLKKACTR